MPDARDVATAIGWARRRAAGEHVEAIAADAGCAPITVYRATRPYGPFLQPQQARRYFTTDPRSGDWIRRRRDRQSIASIAARDSVPEHKVREATRAHGPYPRARPRPATCTDPEIVKQWVTARRNGHTLIAIAQSAGVTPRVVRTATASFGPFHPTGNRDGLLGVTAVAQLLGMTGSTVIQWRTTGFLPAADTSAPRGHDLWQTSTITQWADGLDLPTCPRCGARPKDLNRHISMLHRSRSTT